MKEKVKLGQPAEASLSEKAMVGPSVQEEQEDHGSQGQELKAERGQEEVERERDENGQQRVEGEKGEGFGKR